MSAQQKSEELVYRWQKDCRPMTDPVSLEELEKRITALLEKQAPKTKGVHELWMNGVHEL